MNKQGANYVESVGDNYPHSWQTKKHNQWGLGISLFFFVALLITFWLFNRTSVETASISLKEQKEENRITQSTIYMTYAQAGDFNFVENGGEVSYRMPKNWWYRLWAPATTQLFAINHYDQNAIMNDDTLTTINIDRYRKPKARNKNELKAISDKKQYMRYSDLHFSLKLKSSLSTPFKFNKTRIDSVAYTDIYQYSEYKYRTRRDSTFMERDLHLYGKCEQQETYDTLGVRRIQTDKGLRNEYTLGRNTTKTYILGDSKLNSYQLNLFGLQRHFRFTNRTCCNLYIESLEFPCEQNCKFVLSFAAPMFFDILSIEPDKKTTNELVYTSPEKIQALKESGLYVFARDISANNQEMINFLLATILGIFISYVIEFIKRLYNAYMDKKHQNI